MKTREPLYLFDRIGGYISNYRIELHSFFDCFDMKEAIYTMIHLN